MGMENLPKGTFYLYAIDSKGRTGPEVARTLRLPDLSVLIRYRFPKHELTSSYLRISIGNASDMNILMERIIEWKTQEQL